jgi:hypothetical protein
VNFLKSLEFWKSFHILNYLPRKQRPTRLYTVDTVSSQYATENAWFVGHPFLTVWGQKEALRAPVRENITPLNPVGHLQVACRGGGGISVPLQAPAHTIGSTEQWKTEKNKVLWVSNLELLLTLDGKFRRKGRRRPLGLL